MTKKYYINENRTQILCVEGESINVFTTFPQGLGEASVIATPELNNGSIRLGNPSPHALPALKRIPKKEDTTYKNPGNDIKAKIIEASRNGSRPAEISADLGVTAAYVYATLSAARKAGELVAGGKKKGVISINEKRKEELIHDYGRTQIEKVCEHALLGTSAEDIAILPTINLSISEIEDIVDQLLS